jgi:hypothetical protein
MLTIPISIFSHIILNVERYGTECVKDRSTNALDLRTPSAAISCL